MCWDICPLLSLCCCCYCCYCTLTAFILLFVKLLHSLRGKQSVSCCLHMCWFGTCCDHYNFISLRLILVLRKFFFLWCFRIHFIFSLDFCAIDRLCFSVFFILAPDSVSFSSVWKNSNNKLHRVFSVLCVFDLVHLMEGISHNLADISDSTSNQRCCLFLSFADYSDHCTFIEEQSYSLLAVCFTRNQAKAGSFPLWHLLNI